MIKHFDYIQTLRSIQGEITEAIERTLFSGELILGPETEGFEKEFAEYTGAEFCVGINSGTSALTIALMALGIGTGDEVITVSNTCVPTISAIEMTGAVPVFVDVNESDLLMNTDLIEQAITEKTKVILPVHLWGQCVDLDKILRISLNHDLKVVEDCAQATGTLYKGKHVGNFGDAGCFSFYPTKNLGAYGDAGAIVTNDPETTEKIRKIRMYGYDPFGNTVLQGTNGRISEIQAAILRVKLKYLPEWLERRRGNAAFYLKNIINRMVSFPVINEYRLHSFHQFVLRTPNRDPLMKVFSAKGIEYGIHYPIPVHQMPFYSKTLNPGCKLPVTEKAACEIMSIPVHESLLDNEIGEITDVINRFKKKGSFSNGNI